MSVHISAENFNMITTEQFSKKVFLVIVLLASLVLFKGTYFVATSFFLNQHYSPTMYAVVVFSADMLFGVILVLQQRLHIFVTISIVALSLFYPVFASVLYLISITIPQDEQ